MKQHTQYAVNAMSAVPHASALTNAPHATLRKIEFWLEILAAVWKAINQRTGTVYANKSQMLL